LYGRRQSAPKPMKMVLDDILMLLLLEEVQTKINMRVDFEQDVDAYIKMNLSSGATGLIRRNPFFSKRKKIIHS
jgi:hypothetical protein